MLSLIFSCIALSIACAVMLADMQQSMQPQPARVAYLADRMTLEAAQAVAAVLGWKVLKRGSAIYFLEGPLGHPQSCRFQAVAI